MKLTDRQGFCLMTAFLLGNVLASIGGLSKNSKTGYVSVLLAYLIFLLFVWLYQAIFSKNSYQDFFSVTKQLFGNFFHKIILIFTAVYSFLAALFSSTNYLEFIEVSTYYKTPKFAALIIVLLLIVYLCLSREKAMGRYCEIVLPIVFVAVLTLFLCGIKEFKPIHLENIRQLEVKEFFKTGITTFFAPFSEMIFIYILFDNLQTKRHMTRIAIGAGSVFTIIFALMYLFNLMILGKDLLGTLNFPTFYAASVVRVGTIIEKAETLITFSYTFCDLLYSAVCLFVCIKAIALLTKKPEKAKKITAWTAVIFIFFFHCFLENVAVFQKIYPMITLIFTPFTVGLPLLLFLATILRKKAH